MTDDDAPKTPRRPQWWVALTVGVLAAAAAVLVGLYVDAAGDRDHERSRATDLAAREAALREETAALRTEATEARERADAANARFTAVEPCLRQVAAMPSARPLTPAELRDLLRDLPPGEYKFIVPGGSVGLTACKDIAKHLK
ncbi:hypothetical protein [Phytohabitans rumicis]|uniref:hypothetical protein n=1 Tax=Phytohabitans rumicis TaxID=1076125 RepID=UPI00156596EC|nr:hypothetical protein [Phytohabitans rumicis]